MQTFFQEYQPPYTIPTHQVWCEHPSLGSPLCWSTGEEGSTSSFRQIPCSWDTHLTATPRPQTLTPIAHSTLPAPPREKKGKPQGPRALKSLVQPWHLSGVGTGQNGGHQCIHPPAVHAAGPFPCCFALCFEIRLILTRGLHIMLSDRT